MQPYDQAIGKDHSLTSDQSSYIIHAARRKVLIHYCSATLNVSMFLSRRRLVLIGVIAAIAIVIIMLPLILTITLPDVNRLSISLLKVEAVPPDITNASQKTQ